MRANKGVLKTKKIRIRQKYLLTSKQKKEKLDRDIARLEKRLEKEGKIYYPYKKKKGFINILISIIHQSD